MFVMYLSDSERELCVTLEAPEKRESESSEPFFRTAGRNLEGCVRIPEISLRTENAASRAT